MKHCKKHRQDYMDFLHECPICIGEQFPNTAQVNQSASGINEVFRESACDRGGFRSRGADMLGAGSASSIDAHPAVKKSRFKRGGTNAKKRVGLQKGHGDRPGLFG